MPAKWTLLGKGTYNTAYVNPERTLVMKIRIKTDPKQGADFDAPPRSVRLFNQLNPDLPPAYLVNTKSGPAWICPYVEGVQANDTEISGTLVKIFNASGRIVVDAISKRNFLRTPKGQIVCIDIGMALQMEKREESSFTEGVLERRMSITSLDAWQATKNNYAKMFEKHSAQFPKTINIIKALLFIKFNRPDIYNVSFLQDDSKLISQLAKAYDQQDPITALAHLDLIVHKPKNDAIDDEPVILSHKDIEEACAFLKKEVPITFNHIKEGCLKQLEEYINSRGTINSNGDFEPSWTTKIFRDTSRVNQKIELARELMLKFRDIPTLDGMLELIKNAQPIFPTGSLAASLGKCVLILETARQIGLEHEPEHVYSAWKATL